MSVQWVHFYTFFFLLVYMIAYECTYKEDLMAAEHYPTISEAFGSLKSSWL